METKSDVLIVGAGLAGLLAANALQAAGQTVRVVEKARGVGGRLATWRLGPGRGDYGAQFFTVREPTFQKIVDTWLALGMVFEWSRGWADGSAVDSSLDDGFPRYAVAGGMTAVAAVGIALSLLLFAALFWFNRWQQHTTPIAPI